MAFWLILEKKEKKKKHSSGSLVKWKYKYNIYKNRIRKYIRKIMWLSELEFKFFLSSFTIFFFFLFIFMRCVFVGIREYRFSIRSPFNKKRKFVLVEYKKDNNNNKVLKINIYRIYFVEKLFPTRNPSYCCNPSIRSTATTTSTSKKREKK